MIRFATLMNDITEEKQFKTEHGLSFWIEFKKQILLFDMGQSLNFYENMKKLDLDLNQVNRVFLSHGHYDHTGGMLLLDQLNPACKIHVGKHFWDLKYKKESDGYTYKGIPVAAEAIDFGKHVFEEQEEAVKKIDEDIYCITGFLDEVDEPASSRFYKKRGGSMQKDSFEDEIALCLNTQKGMVVFVGCSHPGIIRILKKVKAHFSEPIYAVVGGFHLLNESDEKIQEIAAYFQTHVVKVGTGHCTGINAEHVLKDLYGDDFMELQVGKYYTI